MIISIGVQSGPQRHVLALVSFLLLASCTPAVAQREPLPAPPAPQERPGAPQETPGAPQETSGGPQETPGAPQETPGTIQVSGQSQVMVPADQVRISFAVETEAVSAQDATAMNAAKMDSVLGALRGPDMPRTDIQTFGYELRPEYTVDRETPGGRTITGYRALNNIMVTLRDLQATGDILDRAVAAGANRVSSLQFEASDTHDAQLQALREAVAAARDQAEAIAAAMGVTLGRALEVQGGSSAPSPRSLPMLAVRAEATTPVEPGEQRVAANVTITYRIVE